MLTAIWFAGTTADAASFSAAGALEGEVLFSVRPQDVRLHAGAPAAANGGILLRGKVVERAYLGEHWDYAVAPAGTGERIRVTAPPLAVFSAGQEVWLEIDPGRLVPLPPDG